MTAIGLAGRGNVARRRAVARRQASSRPATVSRDSSFRFPSRASVERPLLAVVDFASLRRQKRRRQWLVAAFVAFICALFAVALVQAMLVQKQRELDVLNVKINEARVTRAGVEREVLVLSSPKSIVERAGVLGMVRAEDPVELVAVDGQ